MVRRKRGPSLAVVLLVAALVTGCTTGDGDAPFTAAAAETASTRPPTTTTTAPAPTTTTTVALPPPVPMGWAPCGGGFQCATTDVPVDYENPGGATLSISLIKRPASEPGERIGTLIMNPGGPGASGVNRVRRGFSISDEVAARFDIVGFDPRGVGQSTPVSCGAAVDAFRSTDLGPDDEQESTALELAARAVAEECTATEGERLAHLGTVEVVRDLEVIRRNLGEPQISFVGLSYGTLIGLLWADEFPTSVRAMVLDGVSDPAAVSSAMASTQVAALEDAFAEVDAACAADPSCPFSAQGRRLLDAYDELAAQVEQGAGAGSGVGPTQLAYAAFSATYGTDRWAPLWHAVDKGLAGDLSDVARLSAWFTGLVDYVPFALVNCLDAPHPLGFEAWQENARAAAERSPRFGAVAANELLPCAFWPSTTRTVAPVDAAGAPPILVVGSTGDVATPYAQAEQVAADLESGVLLTVDMAGHVAIGDSDCAEVAITRYLVDLAPPPPGTRCAADG